jgi:hypothetical protein
MAADVGVMYPQNRRARPASPTADNIQLSGVLSLSREPSEIVAQKLKIVVPRGSAPRGSSAEGVDLSFRGEDGVRDVRRPALASSGRGLRLPAHLERLADRGYVIVSADIASTYQHFWLWFGQCRGIRSRRPRRGFGASCR